MKRLQLWLCGGFRCRLDGLELGAPPRRDAARLLSLLALGGPQPQPRAAVAAALWPCVSPERARANLRPILHSLQQYLGRSGQASCLLASADSLDWAPGTTVWVDLRQSIADAADPADPQAPPPALPVGDLPDWSDAWFETWRIRFDAARAELLERSSAAQESSGDRTGAKQDSLRLLALRPTDEAANLRLLRLLVAEGDRAGARRQLERCLQAFDDDLGRRPSPAFLAAAELVLAAPKPTAPAGEEGPDPALHQLPTIDGADRLGRLRAAAQRHPLLLLLGPAGCGKSRLLEGLRRSLDAALWVDLAQGSADQPLQVLAETLAQAEPKDPVTVFIDHAELAPGAELERLLLELARQRGGTPRMVLASRRPLSLRGAQRWPVAAQGASTFLQEDEAGQLLRAVWREQPLPPGLLGTWSLLTAALAGRPSALLLAADRLRRAADPLQEALALAQDPAVLLPLGLPGARFASLADSLAADARWLEAPVLAVLRALAGEEEPLGLADLAARTQEALGPGAGRDPWNPVQTLIQAGLLLPAAGDAGAEPGFRLDALTRRYWSGAAPTTAEGAA